MGSTEWKDRLTRLPGHLAVFGFFLLLTAVILWPITSGDKGLLSHDNLLGYYPLFVFKGLWNDTLQGGFPLFADPQSQTFFPFPRLFASSVNGFECYAGFLIALGCFFAYLLAYDLTRSRWPSVIAGMIYGFSGSVLGQISMINVSGTSVWLPLLLLFFLRIARGSREPLDSLGAALTVFAALISGHTQFFVHFMFFCGILMLFYAYEDRRVQWARLIRAGAASILGVIASGFVLVPFLELLPLTPRAGRIAVEGFASYEMPLAQLIRLFYPYFFGAPGEHSITGTYPFAHSGFHNFHELNRTFGLLPFLLVLPGWTSIRDTRLRWFLAGSFVFYALFVLGSQTPLIHVLMKIPVMNRFRGPSRHFLEITLIASVIAAFGLRAVFTEVGRRSWILALAAVAVIIGVLPVMWIGWEPSASALFSNVTWLSISGNHGVTVQWVILALLSAGLCVLMKAQPGTPARIVLLAVVGTAAFLDLAFGQRFTDWYLNAAGSERIEKQESFPWERLDRGYRTYFKIPNAFDAQHYYRFSWSAPNLTVPNLSILSGQPEFSYYNPLSLASWHKITLAGQFRPELLELFGVRYEGGVYRTDYLPATEPLLIGGCGALSVPFAIETGRRRVFTFPAPLSGPVKVYTSVICGTRRESLRVRGVTDGGGTVTLNLNLETQTGDFRGCSPALKPVMTSRNGRDCIQVYARELELPPGSRLMRIEFQEPVDTIVQVHGVSGRTEQTEAFFNLPVLERLSTEKPFFLGPNFVIYENRDALPEAYFAARARAAKGDRGLLLLTQPGSAREKVVIDSDTLPASLSSDKGERPGQENARVAVEKNGHSRVRVTVETELPGMVVLNHTYYPGWKAFVDGQEKPIYRVNLTVRGVEVGPGKHVIEFVFSPRSLWIGLGVSVAGLGLLAWWVLRGLNRLK